MPNNLHQKYREKPESFCKSKEGYCFDDNQLLRLLFKQLKNERYIAEVGVSAIGEIDNAFAETGVSTTGKINDMLLKQVFQQRKKLVLHC